jgi:hypothetical protein
MKVHYCSHMVLIIMTILSQINLIHTFLSYFFKSHLNIIIPAITSILCGLFPTITLYEIFSHPSLIPYSIIIITFGKAYQLWNYSLCSFLPLQSNILLCTLFSNKNESQISTHTNNKLTCLFSHVWMCRELWTECGWVLYVCSEVISWLKREEVTEVSENP